MVKGVKGRRKGGKEEEWEGGKERKYVLELKIKIVNF